MHSVTAGTGTAVRRSGPPLLRVAAGVTVLWFLVRHVGAAPFGNGLRAVTWRAVLATAALTALTTACSAWRWRVVARALGADVGLPDAVGAYYRSLFLNSVLPGGILGDVHRAVTHGRRAGDVARGVRAVAWERLCGQVIQAAVTAVVLLTLPSPVRPALPFLLAGVAGAAGCAALVLRGTARRGRSRLNRVARAVAADLRRGLLAPGVWPQIALASVLVVCGHTATFVIAARVAGCTAPLGELVALLMVVQTVAVIPLSIGGWGPREGAAAWAFAAAGLGSARGVTVATLYAVLMLAAVAPGAGLLLRDAVRRRRGPVYPGESRAPDPVRRTMEAARGLPRDPAIRGARGHQSWPRHRTGRNPGPGRAVRRRLPHLPACLARIPGRRPGPVVGGLAELRPGRGRDVHRPVGLLAWPRPGALGVAPAVDRHIRAPACLAHPAAVLGRARVQPGDDLVRARPARLGRAQR